MLKSKYFESRYFNLYLFSFFTAVTFLLYHTSLNNYYVHDDFVRLRVASEGALSENFHFFPVPLLVYRVLFLLFGESPLPARVINYMLNAVMCMIVYRFSLQSLKLFAPALSENKMYLVSFASALYFCTHFIHVETIVYYSELHEMFYSVFFLGGLYLYLKYKAEQNKKYLLYLFLSFLLCMLSKETAVTFGVCLFLSEYFLFRTPVKNFIKTYYPLAVIVVMFVAVRFLYFPKMELLNKPESVLSILIETVKNYIFSFTALLFSLDFVFIKNIYRGNDLNLTASFYDMITIYPGAVAAMILIAVIYIFIFRKPDRLKIILLCFIVIVIASFAWVMGYERYLYLPSAGFCLLLTYALVNSEKLSIFNNKLLYVIFTLIVAYNVYFLKEKESQWVTASEISRKTVSSIISVTKDLPQNSTVYFPNLPGEYKSSWLLRFGVQEVPTVLMKRNDMKFNYKHKEDIHRENINKNDNVYIYDYFSGTISKP